MNGGERERDRDKERERERDASSFLFYHTVNPLHPIIVCDLNLLLPTHVLMNYIVHLPRADNRGTGKNILRRL